jgi:hypothetical protein
MVDTMDMIDIDELRNSDIEYVEELIILADRATTFLKSQKWCRRILRGWLDRGWGIRIAVFYFYFEPTYKDVPHNTWVIVGDLPPAYIDAEDNPNGACAIDGYVLEMQKWVDAVTAGEGVEGLIPVNVPPSKEYAKMLQHRLTIIKKDILADCEDELRALVSDESGTESDQVK